MFKFQLAEFSVQWDNMGVRVLKGLEEGAGVTGVVGCVGFK